MTVKPPALAPTLTTTGFPSAWSGLTDLTTNFLQIMPATTPHACPDNRPVHGRAYGVEVLLRRPLSKRPSGWLSYTLSRSTRDEHFITPTGRDVVAAVASDYDRTHVLNAISAYDLGRRWRAGGRFLNDPAADRSGSPDSSRQAVDGERALPPRATRHHKRFVPSPRAASPRVVNRIGPLSRGS